MPLSRGADRLSLLARVAAFLRERRIPFAVVGAAAMAVHGVSRGTRDIDILAMDSACLERGTWAGLEKDGITATIRRGDADDPLAGAVRLTHPGPAALDVIIGRPAWQSQVLARAVQREIEGAVVPVATVADLVLLKLYAGGPQDAWDIEQLLDVPGRTELFAAVETGLATLPEDSRRLWARIVGPR